MLSGLLGEALQCLNAGRHLRGLTTASSSSAGSDHTASSARPSTQSYKSPAVRAILPSSPQRPSTPHRHSPRPPCSTPPAPLSRSTASCLTVVVASLLRGIYPLYLVDPNPGPETHFHRRATRPHGHPDVEASGRPHDTLPSPPSGFVRVQVGACSGPYAMLRRHPSRLAARAFFLSYCITMANTLL
ncbi:hypothetical protein C8F01DRAFT_1174564 [Mycena amicta]|nr:hypothetical protein C8F01DRAFT_1174564 [Mycena amicta]